LAGRARASGARVSRRLEAEPALVQASPAPLRALSAQAERAPAAAVQIATPLAAAEAPLKPPEAAPESRRAVQHRILIAWHLRCPRRRS